LAFSLLLCCTHTHASCSLRYTYLHVELCPRHRCGPAFRRRRHALMPFTPTSAGLPLEPSLPHPSDAGEGLWSPAHRPPQVSLSPETALPTEIMSRRSGSGCYNISPLLYKIARPESARVGVEASPLLGHARYENPTAPHQSSLRPLNSATHTWLDVLITYRVSIGKLLTHYPCSAMARKPQDCARDSATLQALSMSSDRTWMQHVPK
jgi:hypothetical protein